jgi:hypothetical protein
METRDDILKELQQIAPKLSALNKVNYYTVPDGYFEELKLSLLQNISTENANGESFLQGSILSKIEKPVISVNDVPEGYFNTFAVNILQKIKQDELSEVAPTLAALPKINFYTVPEGYFNTLPKQLVKQAVQESMPKPRRFEWMDKLNNSLDELAAAIFKPQYASAFAGLASVLLIIGIAFYKPQAPCADAMCQLEKGLSGLSDEEIISYINENSQDFDAAMISDQTDEKALNTMQVNDAEFDKQLDEFMQSEFSEEELYKNIQGS